ncbi:MAG: hypothetical protein H0V17_31015 [Deltaproteobacteria bacterium]|nr:hypothetical protein [Deltaproteobacteria bacterium]
MQIRLAGVIVAMLVTPALGDQKLDGSTTDPRGPEPTAKLAGTVLVWNDATFYLDADDKASTQLATIAGPRKDHVGQVVPLRVVSTTGDFVEVESVVGTDCTWTKLPQPEDLTKLRLFVKRSDLAPVVVKPFTKTWPNGTSLAVRAGLPALRTAHGALSGAARSRPADHRHSGGLDRLRVHVCVGQAP